MAADRITLRVGEADAGSRLDRFLADPLGSRARAQRQIDSGRVTVDGRPSAKSHVVAAGELVEVEPEAIEADAAPVDPAPFRIAYEDDYLLVVDKPAGVVVHPARGHPEGTLSHALARPAARGEGPRPRVRHP